MGQPQRERERLVSAAYLGEAAASFLRYAPHGARISFSLLGEGRLESSAALLHADRRYSASLRLHLESDAIDPAGLGGIDGRKLASLLHEAIAESASKPVCSVCNDTHYVDHDSGRQLCTSCPVPCQRCRAGGNGPFCESTPCGCECHLVSR